MLLSKKTLYNGYMKQSGQALLITLLVLSVAGTIVLSLIGRTTQDVSLSREIEESSQAFSAAEAGLEEALITGSSTTDPITLSSGASYDVTVADTGGAAGVYTFPKVTPNGTTETLWLVEHNDADGTLVEVPTYTSNTLELCWSSETTTPAVVITVLYKEASDGSYQVAKLAFDRDRDSRGNNFVNPGVAGNHCGQNPVYSTNINFPSLGISPATDILLALRIRPVYSDTQLYAETGGQVLPLQGKRIESTGTTPGGVNRKILVFQQYRSPSSIFDAAVYSQGSFSH